MDLIFVIILGALWGSFANVCIIRMPQGKGVIVGRSFCVKCNKKIQWFDNIPIISYLLLKFKCRNCKTKISFQYFLVETISLINFLVLYLIFGISLNTLFLIILSVVFLIIFFIDLKHYIIPNSLTYSMMILGFIKSFVPNLDPIFPNFLNSLIGGLLGYGIIWSIIYFYRQFKKKEGMGLGDAKLLAGFGFLFGLKSVFIILFVASIIGLVYSVPKLIVGKSSLNTAIPFGPFLIISAIVYYLYLSSL